MLLGVLCCLPLAVMGKADTQSSCHHCLRAVVSGEKVPAGANLLSCNGLRRHQAECQVVPGSVRCVRLARLAPPGTPGSANATAFSKRCYSQVAPKRVGRD